jgi:hypothetical protein
MRASGSAAMLSGLVVRTPAPYREQGLGAAALCELFGFRIGRLLRESTARGHKGAERHHGSVRV